VHGEGEPTLVFIHGWSCHRLYWVEQLDRFQRVRRVVAIDLMGHGESDSNREDWTMEAFGDDVVRVCDALKLEHIVLIGHSMGGPVALEAAKQLGSRVVAIVGVDTLLDVDRHMSDEQIEVFLAPFRADFPSAVDGFVREHMFPPGANPELVDLVAGRMSTRPPEAALAMMESLLRYDSAPALAAVHVPVHCITSSGTANVLGNQKYNPQFTAVEMPGVGHFPMLEDPERFARLLADFVRPLGQPTATDAAPPSAN
jgi:pimeloyl-ACP methyl ester carboxylesterase